MADCFIIDLPYILRKDDEDNDLPGERRRYGGRIHDGPHNSNWVACLQATLAKLGFVLNPDWGKPGHQDTRQIFDDETEWAVREFQMSALLPKAAKLLAAENEEIDEAIALTGDAKYPDNEPVSGVVNEATRKALGAWVEQELICPVRVAVLVSGTNQPKDKLDNLWRDFGHSSNLQISVRDRSGYYSATRPLRGLDKFQPLAELQKYNGSFGPITTAVQALSGDDEKSEVLPEYLFTLPADTEEDANGRQMAMFSTFRVIRAVADVECYGFFEGGNAYDSQIISIGLCNWTIAPGTPITIEKGKRSGDPLGKGELPAFLAYCRQHDFEAYQNGFGKFGLGTHEPWEALAGSVDGRNLRDPAGRKYTAAPTQQDDARQGVVPPYKLIHRRNLRYWHWYYRFITATRTIDGFRRAMWDMTRLRVRDILSTQWPDTDGPYPQIKNRDGTLRPATLGETLQSQLAVAIVLRWHVISPGDMVSGESTGNILKQIYKALRPYPPFKDYHDVTLWDSRHEMALIESISERFKIDNTINGIRDWQNPLTATERKYRLREVIGLDKFDIEVLPPAVEPAYTVLVNAPPPDSWHDLPAALRARFDAIPRPLPLSNPKYRRVTPTNKMIGAKWEVQDRDEHGAVTRTFYLHRPTRDYRIEVLEYPVLSAARGSFQLDVTGLPIGLPAPKQDAPLIEYTGVKAKALLDILDQGGVLDGNVLDTIKKELRLALPLTDIRFESSTTPVLCETNRWSIPTLGNPNLTFFTVRKIDDHKVRIDPPGSSLRYGGKTLKQGDDNPEVLLLRHDLRLLGFHLIPEPTGADSDKKFDRHLASAVRAFQTYARRPRVARLNLLAPIGIPLVKKLIAVNVPATQRYQGPVSGVVDRETTVLIEHWLSFQNHWRCPVVIDARSEKKEGSPGEANVLEVGGAFLDNLWKPDDDKDVAHYFFVTDFSESENPQCLQLGRYRAGPKIENSEDFKPAQKELTAKYLTGVENPTGKTRNTYQVIRAVADGSPCGGFLDAVDAAARTTRGVTLGWFDLRNSVEHSNLVGGLGALFSIARHLELRDYHADIGRDGIQESYPWTDNAKLKKLLQGDAHGTLSSGIARQNRAGGFDRFVKLSDMDEWRGWHFLYRLRQTGRRERIARAVWDLSRLQLQRFRTVPLRLPFISTLGKIFTSQQAWAVFYFWFTRFPEDILTRPATGVEAADAIKEAVDIAGLAGPPQNDVEEQKLVTALVAKAKERHSKDSELYFRDTLDKLGTLKVGFQSFELDEDHLPFIPEAVGQGLLTVAVRIGPMPASGSGAPLFAIECKPDPLSPTLFQVTHALFGLPSPSGGAIQCVRVPLLATQGVTLPLDDGQASNTLSVTSGAADTEEVMTAFRIDPTAGDSSLLELENMKLDFDPGKLFGSGSRIGNGSIKLADLRFDDNGDIKGGIRALVEMGTPFGKLPLSFSGSGDACKDALSACPAADFSVLSWGGAGKPITADTTTLGDKLLALAGWPLKLRSDAPFTLTAASAGDSFSARLESPFDNKAGLDLIPTLVRLELEKVKLVIDGLDGLSLALHDGVEKAKGSLGADLFADATGGGAELYVNHVYQQLEPSGDAFGKLFSLSTAGEGAPLGKGARVLGWDAGGRALLVNEFFNALTDIKVDAARRMRTFSGEMFGDATACRVNFIEQANEKPRIEPGPDAQTLRLVVPLVLRLGDEKEKDKDILRLEGEFGFLASASADGVWFGPGSFRAEPEVMLRVQGKTFESGYAFGDAISLHVPEGTAFVFSTDPTRASIRWDRQRTLEGTAKRMFVRVPASDCKEGRDHNQPEAKRFTFELDTFAQSSHGFDLKGAVRVENVKVNGDGDEAAEQAITGFKAPLAVQRPEVARPKDGEEADEAQTPDVLDEPVGVVEFASSQLVRGSVRAGFQLRYFDDAKGTITFLLAEDRQTKKLTLAGSVEINTLVEYRLEALLCTFQIRSLKLQTSVSVVEETHERETKKVVNWASEGAISGAVKFLPSAGQSVSGPLAAISDLFSGVTCEFEDLNPVKLGYDTDDTDVTFHFPAKTFTFGNVMEVDLNGITVGGEKEKKFSLLGDVRLKNLPGVNGSLTFGGIELAGADPGKLPIPTFKRIGAALSIPGGGEFEAVFERVDNEREKGFAGALALRTKTLPPVTGMISLTEARCVIVDPKTNQRQLTHDTVPSLALNTTAGIEAPLGYGFYLREFGLGFGIFRSLRNLGGASSDLPITRRILKFVEDPSGLPDPARADGWEPDTPPKPGQNPPNWMAVGKALITFGKLPPDQPHLVAGTLIAAFDHLGKTTLGMNLWLFTSPNETRQAGFLANPTGRGAIQIDPEAGKIFGVFRTLPNPKLGANAPPLLGEVLGAYQTQMMFLADRNGFLVELGWPWETRVTLPLPSPMRGALSSGYRYGVYRGVVVAQMNYGIDVLLEAEAGFDFNLPLGKAGVKFTVRGSGYFRASLVGAFDQQFRPYLLGDVRVAATVEVGVQAHLDIAGKLIKWNKIRRPIRVSTSFNISIAAALAAAFGVDGIPGYSGEANVSVCIWGYRIAGQVSFQCRPEKVQQTRERLRQILPEPISTPSEKQKQPSLTNGPAGSVPNGKGWQYRSRRVGNTNKIVIALLPEPGLPYPRLVQDPDETKSDGTPRYDLSTLVRFKLDLTTAGANAFAGFVGDPSQEYCGTQVDNALHWQEYLLGNVLSADEIARDCVILERDPSAPPKPPQHLTVARFLYGFDDSDSSPPSGFFGVTEEIKDPRTIRPGEDDHDEPSSRVAPHGTGGNGSSAYFRRDSAYDLAISQSCNRDDPLEPKESLAMNHNSVVAVDGVSTGLIAAEVIDLFGNDLAGHGGRPDGIFIADRLRLVLMFDLNRLDETLRKKIQAQDDPASFLIDFDREKPLTVREDEFTLEHHAAKSKNRQYHLSPGHWFQQREQICLCWDFRFADSDPTTKTPLEAHDTGFGGFRVIRTNKTNSASQSKITVVTPAWLDSGPGSSLRYKLGTSDKLVRAPFQFVDELGDPEGTGNDIRLGDVLEYEVEAIVANGQRVAFKQMIVREVVKPLSPPVAALALHRPAWGNDRNHFKDNGMIEIALMTPAKRKDAAELDAEDSDAFEPQEFKVRYRFVKAGTVGQYGLNTSPAITANPEPSLPAQATEGLMGDGQRFVDIRFNSSPQGRPMPWEDQELHELHIDLEDWQEIKTLSPATEDNPVPEPILLGYRVVKPVEDMLKVNVPHGKAVEFWIGRDRTPKETPGKLERSVLVPCRHAVEMPEVPTHSLADPTLVRRDYFMTASTVPTIEFLPKVPLNKQPVDWFLPRTHIEHVVRAGTLVKTGSATVPNDVVLCMAWRMPEEIDTSLYDPVIGFRVYRADRFNPARHRVVENNQQEKELLPQLEAEFQVVSELLYRSMPATISVKAVQKAGAEDAFTGDWQAVSHSEKKLWTYDAAPTDLKKPFPFKFKDDPNRPGVTLLFEDLHIVAEAIVQALKEVKVEARPSWTITEPFEDRADLRISEHKAPRSKLAEHLKVEFGLFSNSHEPKHDPYAWGIAEAIGLSAEVVFLDALRGEPVDLDGVLRNRRDDFFNALKDAIKNANPAVVITVFMAEDGLTVLNPIRLTYLGPWPTWEWPRGFDLQHVLLLKLIGRDPNTDWPPKDFPGPAEFKEVDEWLTEVSLRLWRSFSIPLVDPQTGNTADLTSNPENEQDIVGRIVRFQRTGTLPVMGTEPGTKLPRVLPIDCDGWVRLDLPVPDRLAHTYDIAVEPIRRYDLIRLQLYQEQERTNADFTDNRLHFRPEFIPFSHIVSVHVERSRPLVPHNVIATPLPGSIQAYVFTHPAEFASCASAINAASVEYSGQTVFLERRVTKLHDIANIFASFPVNWNKYQEYLESHGYEARVSAPELDLAPERKETNLAFRPVEGTRVGVFGADRYVFPDLPGYYEYRLAVFSTAGRAQSPMAFSPFVAPLYDMIRQRPTTEGKFTVEFNKDAPDTLMLRVNMVHPRLHLREEMRGLWVDADEKLALREDSGHSTLIRLGSLPDLSADYIIYLNANYRPGDLRPVPVLNPLVELVSPLDTGQVNYLARSPNDLWVKVLPPNLSGEGGQANIVNVKQDDATGALRLVIPLRFTSDARDFVRPILEASRQQPVEFDKVFFFAVRRGGVCSQIVSEMDNATDAEGSTND